ncbi:MAG: 16S rRNA (guanine(966)-N(2))-methyltransferase RsmD [Clostridiales Family XIII bacterium]|jgi:16S rRNA (guanine966-N2)-methyltransferase|nr:16S rRNA (guanine(966)-N(2))-methyltransferase RsmD [Clostridiales Family XIII bacterium]
MRIIAGKYKGRRLELPKLYFIRPTKDKVKEAVFSSIQNEIINSVFVDLFSGTGAIGIEALSRGAEEVYFIDNNKEAINLIKRNTIKLNEETKYQIINGDWSRIKSFKKNSIDIIYIDPPYEKLNYHKVIKKILALEILKVDSHIIIERDRDVFLEKILSIEKTRKYGKTFIDFCKIYA